MKWSAQGQTKNCGPANAADMKRLTARSIVARPKLAPPLRSNAPTEYRDLWDR